MCGKLLKAALICQMLVHAIFGCCWHHTHCPPGDGGGPQASEERERLETRQHRHCRHPHATRKTTETEQAVANAGTRGNSTAPQDELPAPCEEERCAYLTGLAPDSTPVRFNQTDVGLSSPLERVTSLHGAGLLRSNPPACRREGLTPGERCARLQTWLI